MFVNITVHTITEKVSSSEFTFAFLVTIIISVLVQGRYKNLKSGFVPHVTVLVTTIIIITINITVNSEDDTFSATGCNFTGFFLIISFITSIFRFH
jgi:hypothetical protein